LLENDALATHPAVLEVTALVVELLDAD